MPGPRHKCKPSHRWELKLVQFQEKVLKEMSNISRSLSLIVESRKIEYETIRKSANSINVITRFLAGQCKMSSTDLRNVLIDADALVSNVYPTDILSPEQLHQSCSTMSPHIIEETKSDNCCDHNLLTSSVVNVPISSNNTAGPSQIVEDLEKKKLRMKYNNKYKYMPDKVHSKVYVPKPKSKQFTVNDVTQNDVVPGTSSNKLIGAKKITPKDVSVAISKAVQSTVNDVTQNDVVPGTSTNTFIGAKKITRKDVSVAISKAVQSTVNNVTQNDVVPGTSTNVIAQNELVGDKKITREDVEQNKDVYEMLKRTLSPNHPYNDPTQDVNNADLLRIQLANGQTILKPLTYVQPLLLLKRLDSKSIPVRNRHTLGEHSQSSSQSSSSSTTYANGKNTTAEKNKIETRLSKRKRSNTNTKTKKKEDKSSKKKK